MIKNIKVVITIPVIRALAMSAAAFVTVKVVDAWQKKEQPLNDKMRRYSVGGSNLKVWATPDDAGRYNRYRKARVHAEKEFLRAHSCPWDPKKDLLELEGVAMGDELAYDRVMKQLDKAIDKIDLEKTPVDFSNGYLTPA